MTIRYQVTAVCWSCLSWAMAVCLALASQLSASAQLVDAAAWLAFAAVLFLVAPPFVWFAMTIVAFGVDEDARKPTPNLYRCIKCDDLVTVLHLDGPQLGLGVFLCRRCAGEPVGSTNRKAA